MPAKFRRCQEELSAVRRENELQQDLRFLPEVRYGQLIALGPQDLQIYLSDVFELGIEELNEASLNEAAGAWSGEKSLLL